jgi:hypothetical protein
MLPPTLVFPLAGELESRSEAHVMTRFRVVLLLAAVAVVGIQVSVSHSSTDTPNPQNVTFHKDVLPVLQKNCQVCHRPGEIGPMSFLNYESTRPWAKAIKAAVINKQMPPWLADPQYGEFRNAPQLTEADVKTLVAWADNGAKEGDIANKPADIQWADGWRIKPDVVVSMPQPARIQAKGEGDIREFVIQSPFKEDTWVTSIEVRPGNPSVVHHVILQWADTARENAILQSFGPAIRAAAQRAALADGRGITPGGYNDLSSAHGLLSKVQELRTGQGSFQTMESVYAPGTSPIDFRYTDSAKLLKGGGQLRIQVHYTPNGKETTDQTKIGFTLAKTQVNRSFVLMTPKHLIDPRKPIPAGDANYETSGELTFNQDAELVWFMPHMHLRGKDMTFQLFYPDGRTETVLKASFSFNWQLGYEVMNPIKMPKGTRMLVTAHHDNSANNKSNPDAAQNVLWGDLTGQEMMVPWFGVVVNKDASPETIATYRPRDLVVDDVLRALDRAITSGNISNIGGGSF